MPTASRVHWSRRPAFWVALAVLCLACAIGWRVVRKHRADAVMQAAAGSGAIAGTNGAGRGASAAKSGLDTVELLPTDVAVAAIGSIARTVEVSGQLRAVNQAVVRTRVGGQLLEMNAREGQAVTAGQVLARIDPTEYNLRVRQATDNVAAAQGQLDIAQKNRDNNQQLARQGFISNTALENAEAQLQTARATVAVNRAALELARKSLNETVIRAPIAGVISVRATQPGENVAAEARLMEVVDLRELELEAAVPAADVASVSVGQAVTVRPEGVDQPLTGRVVRINPANTSGSRSYLAYVRLANLDGRLRAGLFAQGTITVAERSGVLTVPTTAVRAVAGGASSGNAEAGASGAAGAGAAAGPAAFAGANGTSGTSSPSGAALVYAIEDGRVQVRPIRTGAVTTADGGKTEVVAGLAPGARIVRVNLGTLPPGAPVHIVGAATPANPASQSNKGGADTAAPAR